MVKISTLSRAGNAITLQLEGRLLDLWVTEVRTFCDTLLSEDSELILDLANLSFCDSQGITLLQDLQARRVRLVNCSPFLAGQINDGGESECSS
jgi:ABC-type transporter Mla MlaB component